MMAGYRDDGVADWYFWYSSEGRGRDIRDRVGSMLALLLPEAKGRLLDIGCGYGPHAEVLRPGAQLLVGLDASETLIKRAKIAYDVGVVASASCLPFASRSFDTFVSTMTATDIGDLAAVAAECRRVARDSARFVLVSSHPCFAGPGVTRNDDGTVTVPPIYSSPAFMSAADFTRGIRSLVGAWSVSLTRLVRSFVRNGWRLDEIEEGLALGEVPHLLGLVFVASECPSERSDRRLGD